MDGREAWQSVPKEASLGRKRIFRDVFENTGNYLILTSLSSTLSTRLPFRPMGNQTDWNDHLNPLSAFCSAPWTELALQQKLFI